jgi:AraC family transcriptional regulator
VNTAEHVWAAMAFGATWMQQNTGVFKEHNPDRQKADLHVFNGIPESAGPRLTTFRGSAAHSVRLPGSHTFQATDHLMSIVLTPAPGMRAARQSDKVHEFDAPVGMLAIIPANEENYVAWSSARENVVIALTPESLQELAAQEFDTGHAELQPPPFGTLDPWALQIAQLLKAELTQREAPNQLYVDSLVTVFGIHLLRNYTEVRKPMPAMRGGLSVRNARRVEEFLDENFSRKLSVAELATVTGLSPHHFIQAFTKTFGEPPHRYLVNRRLTFAEKLLTKGDLTIAEVAYLSGFSGQSHITATMSKNRNRTPMQVRLQR